MEYKDYYKILGVDKKATAKQIKQAYRRLAKQHHPDVNQGNKDAETRFKEINEAHEVLSDAEKRKKYDQLGPNWKQYDQWQRAGGQANGQPFDWSQFGFAAGAGRNAPHGYRTVTEQDLEGLFGDSGPFSGFYHTFFDAPDSEVKRQYRTTPRPRRGQDVEQPVEVSLEEAFQSTMRVLQMSDASGRLRRLEARIPAGVQGGSRVRLAGQGMPGTAGGQAGDLYLIVHVLPHHLFERKGDDLHLKVNVPLTAAVLGGEVEIPTLNGSVMLRVPQTTQNGKSFRLKGKGMPKLYPAGERGDLYVELKVVLPEQLSEREQRLFEELASLRTEGKEQPMGTPA